MTLEDFFTLAEMKNGLTTSERVEELINVIQVQNCITNNVGDAARQWSIAVGILASTQNSDCLNYFAHLNGLGFLNCWLQEVIKCCSDVEDDEELINTLLGALDKLPMNPTKLITSGIFTTVEKLVCHKNVNIMERAQLLTNKWKFSDDGCQELEKGSSCSKPSDAASIDVQPAVEEEIRDEGKCRIESDRTKNPQIICDGDIQLGDGDIVKGFTCNQTLLQTTLVSDAGHHNLSVPQVSSVPFSSELNGDEASNMSSRNDIKSGSKEGKSTLSNNEALHRCASVDALCQEYLKTAKEQKSGESGSADLLYVPTHGSSWKDDTAENTSDIERCNEPTLKACEGDVRFVNETSGVKVAQEIKNHSDLDVEVGEIDAVEIARQVAIQVEREVADYREELCSSPDMDSNEMIIDSPGTEPLKHGHCIPDEENGNLSVPVDGNCEFGSSSKEKSQVVEHVAISSSKQETPNGATQETPNGATINNESDSMAEVVNFDFDLNKDACNEIIDDTVSVVNLSTPIATFASKVAPGFLNAPPHFEGEFGWRDCAATSAFWPASPQTTMLEKEEWDSKHKAKVIGIDLNAFASEAFVTMDRNNSVSEVHSLRTERGKLDLNYNGEEEEVTLSHTSFIEHHYRNGDLSLFPTSSSPQPSPPPRQSSCINFDLNDNMFLSDVSVSRNVFEISADDPSGTVLGSTYSLERRIHSNQSHMGSGLCFDTTFADMPKLTHSHQIPHPIFGYIGATTRPASPFQPATYSYTELPHLYSPAGTTISAASVTRPFLTSIASTSCSNGPCLDLNFGIGGSREERNLMHPFVLSPYSLTDEEGTSGSLLKRKEPDCGWEPHNFDYKHLKTWL